MIVNTIPWSVWAETSNAANDIKFSMRKLEAVPLTVALVQSQGGEGPQWSYCPGDDVEYHRRFFASRWMPSAKFDFTETNTKRFSGNADVLRSFSNEYAYPVYSGDSDAAMASLSSWAARNGILPLGRWGTWDYANSDVCIHHALSLAATQSFAAGQSGEQIARIA